MCKVSDKEEIKKNNYNNNCPQSFHAISLCGKLRLFPGWLLIPVSRLFRSIYHYKQTCVFRNLYYRFGIYRLTKEITL